MSLIIADFQILFYQTKYAELEVEIDTLEKELANKDAAEMARQMADTSENFLNGYLDDFILYNRILSEEEIQDLYNN